MIKIKSIKVDTKNLVKRFTAMSRRAEDFKPVFRWSMLHLAAEHAKLFAANGALPGSSAWEALEESTVAWKLANGYGAAGILVRNGTLKDSLTNLNSARGAVRDIDRKTASFGTSLDYAGYHFYGTRNMDARKPLFVPEHFSWRTANAVANHIVHGKIPESIDRLLP